MRSLIARVVAASVRYRWLVILVAAAIASGALVYTTNHLAIDTDSNKLISADLPWRQREATFDAAFPQRVDIIAIVVDGETPEAAEQAASSLASRLSGRTDLFRLVRRPDGGAFFERAGLLFESIEDVSRTTQQLIAAQPLLGTLAADPSLRGVMGALSLFLEGVGSGRANFDELSRPLAALASVFDAVVAGQTPLFSWRTLILGGNANPRELRRFILAQPVLDYSALEPGARAIDAIRETARELGFDSNAGVRIRLTGPVPLADEEFGTLAQGAALNATVTLLLVVILLWAALRSARLIAAVLLTLAMGLIVTTAFGLLAFGAFNLISVAFAVLFIGLGVDFGIQFCVGYRAKRYAGESIFDSLHHVGKDVGPALALAAASIAAGFFAFLPTEYRGVSELGLIAGTGMIVAFVGSITILPALIAVLRPAGERSDVGMVAFAPFDRLLVRHRRGVLVMASVVAAASLVVLPRLQFDFNPMHLRSASAESVATLLDLTKDPETTPNSIDVLTPSLGDATTLAQRLATLPEVDHAMTLKSFVPEHQEEKLALISDAALLLDPALSPAEIKPPPSDDETARSMARVAGLLDQAARAHPSSAAAADARRVAEASRKLGAGEPALRERLRAALIDGLPVMLGQLRAALQAEPVTLDTLPDDLVRDWVAPDGRARIEVFPKGDSNDNATLRRFMAVVLALAPDATGAPISIQESSRTVIRAFVHAGLWALLSIVVLLAIVLRRASDVIVTLAPLTLSGLVTLGICAAIGVPLNFENIIALPLFFGIGVAFNIYYVMAARAGAERILQSSLTRAVLFSALTTGTAFGSLWLSHHPGTASMGKLLALSLACTLAAALGFLPALLGLMRARRGASMHE